jgi:hypothetical protein
VNWLGAQISCTNFAPKRQVLGTTGNSHAHTPMTRRPAKKPLGYRSSPTGRIGAFTTATSAASRGKFSAAAGAGTTLGSPKGTNPREKPCRSALEKIILAVSASPFGPATSPATITPRLVSGGTASGFRTSRAATPAIVSRLKFIGRSRQAPCAMRAAIPRIRIIARFGLVVSIVARAESAPEESLKFRFEKNCWLFTF